MKVYIYLDTGKMYEVDQLGNIKTDIMKVLSTKNKITKKFDNVTERLDNLLYDGHEIKSMKYIASRNEFEMEVSEKVWKGRD